MHEKYTNLCCSYLEGGVGWRYGAGVDQDIVELRVQEYVVWVYEYMSVQYMYMYVYVT